MISRSIIFELKPLDKEDIKTLIKRAVYDEKKGMGSLHADIDDEALTFLADVANGDARSALNAIELGILTTKPSEDGKIHITMTNLSIDKDYEIDGCVADTEIASACGEIVGGEIHLHNTFDKPEEVTVRPFNDIEVNGNRIKFSIPASSVLHLELNIR